MISWYFAIIQLAIEVFKWIINGLAWYQKRKDDGSQEYVAEGKMHEGYSQNVQGHLSNATPKFEISGFNA